MTLQCYCTQRIKKGLSICQPLICLDLIHYPVMSLTKPEGLAFGCSFYVGGKEPVCSTLRIWPNGVQSEGCSFIVERKIQVTFV